LGIAGGFGGFGKASFGGFGRERAGEVVAGASTSGLTTNSGTGIVSMGGAISLGALFEPSIESARAK